MPVITVGLDDRSYPLVIEDGCLATIGTDLAARRIAKRYGVIVDDVVARLFGGQLSESLDSAGIQYEMLVFPSGEASKSLQTLGDLAGRLARLGFDRKDALIGFGGGVTGDLAGFLASTYMRGIPFVQVPTTLLAQVDSSVGGKTGVDIPEGKNLIGAFHQPKAVYIDISVLSSLPETELLGGLAEVIKYGVIRDSSFFEFLEDKRADILQLDNDCITKTVQTCCEIKADVVAEDEREGDVRRILNYGHTIGHAVEGASDYTLIHGHAVAIGMVAAAKIAEMNNLLATEDRKRIVSLIRAYGLPVNVPAALDRSRIKRYLQADKKNIGGTVFYVLPTAIGNTCIYNEVTEEQVNGVLG